MHDKPIFIFSFGRSGSTLLQRTINCSHECLIWGEHAGFLRPLTRSYRAITSDICFGFIINTPENCLELSLGAKPVPVDNSNSTEWMNNFKKEEIYDLYGNLIKSIFTKDLPIDIRWGFKEIRYGIFEYRFLSDLFPFAKFILIIRDPIATLKSTICAFNPNYTDLHSVYNPIMQRFTDIANIIEKYNRCPVLVVKYEEFVQSPVEIMSKICNFLSIKKIADNKIFACLNYKGVKSIRNNTILKKVTDDLTLHLRDKNVLERLRYLYEVFGYEFSNADSDNLTKSS